MYTSLLGVIDVRQYFSNWSAIFNCLLDENALETLSGCYECRWQWFKHIRSRYLYVIGIVLIYSFHLFLIKCVLMKRLIILCDYHNLLDELSFTTPADSKNIYIIFFFISIPGVICVYIAYYDYTRKWILLQIQILFITITAISGTLYVTYNLLLLYYILLNLFICIYDVIICFVCSINPLIVCTRSLTTDYPWGSSTGSIHVGFRCRRCPRRGLMRGVPTWGAH